MSKKTPRSEAYASATPSRDEQEALDMPPPEIPSLRRPELPPSGSMLQRLESEPARGHQSGDSSYASVEDPVDEQQTNPSSSKRRKSWASLTSSDEESQVRDEDFVRPNAQLPAWKNRGVY